MTARALLLCLLIGCGFDSSSMGHNPALGPLPWLHPGEGSTELLPDGGSLAARDAAGDDVGDAEPIAEDSGRADARGPQIAPEDAGGEPDGARGDAGTDASPGPPELPQELLLGTWTVQRAHVPCGSSVEPGVVADCSGCEGTLTVAPDYDVTGSYWATFDWVTASASSEPLLRARMPSSTPWSIELWPYDEHTLLGYEVLGAPNGDVCWGLVGVRP